MYVANINKTKFSSGMASNHGNKLRVTILDHVKSLHSKNWMKIV